MSFNGYRDKALQDRRVLERIAEGERQKEIAGNLGVSYSTLRRRLARHVHAIGCETLEQAVAVHVAEKIKRSLPLALQSQVDLACPILNRRKSEKS